MFRPGGLNENFRFLVLETAKQLEDALRSMEEPEHVSTEKMKNREDYIDNLRNIIAKKSYQRVLEQSPDDKRVIDSMMALSRAVNNLEHISDHCECMIELVLEMESPELVEDFPYHDYFREIFKSIRSLSGGLFNCDIQTALEISGSEKELDRFLERDSEEIIRRLRLPEYPARDLVNLLLVLRYLERIGDALLNVGEAIILAVVGSQLKMKDYTSVRDSLNVDDEEFTLESLGVETRSGCRIEKVRNLRGEEQQVIFKRGKWPKIVEEKRMLDWWQEHFPGLTPRVLNFEKKGEDATLLLEFLRGRNFNQIILGQETDLLKRSLNQILQTLHTLWQETHRPETGRARFIDQLRRRLPDVQAIHPDFTAEGARGRGGRPSFDELIEEAAALEEKLPAPFSCFIHGDFNNDNIIYDEVADKIYFIDLHRSRYTDYVQDVSVFLVSSLRLPVLDRRLRERIHSVVATFFDFSEGYAGGHGDVTFHARLGLGLARSLVTSTRFALERNFARELFFRGRRILEQLLDCSDPEDYRVDRDNLSF